MKIYYFPSITPAGTEYTGTTVTLTFGATILTQMVTVYILDDNVVEDTEFINLALTSVDNAVMINPAATRIYIEDDVDSELTNETTCNFVFPLSCAKVSVILSYTRVSSCDMGLSNRKHVEKFSCATFKMLCDIYPTKMFRCLIEKQHFSAVYVTVK